MSLRFLSLLGVGFSLLVSISCNRSVGPSSSPVSENALHFPGLVYQLSGTSSQYGDSSPRQVVADSKGDLIVSGDFNGHLNLGLLCQTDPTAGYSGSFVAKFSGKNSNSLTPDCLWFDTALASLGVQVTGLAVDSNDLSFVTGRFANTTIEAAGVTLNPMSSPLAANMFIIAYNSLGVPVKAIAPREVAGAKVSSVLPTGIAVASDGSIVVVGNFGGQVDFGGQGIADQILTAVGFVDNFNFSVSDLFVAKFNSNGSLLWVQGFGRANSVSSMRAVSLDSQGNISVTGVFAGQLNFTDDPAKLLVSKGTRDLFVARMTADGSTAWQKSFGSVAGQTAEPWSVASDPKNGDVVVLGSFDGQIRAGTKTIGIPDRKYQIMAMKLSAGSGDVIWANAYGGGTSKDLPTSVTIDSNGSVVITGQVTNSVNFGTKPLDSSPSGLANAFIAILSADGQYKWAERYEGVGNKLSGAAVAKDGLVAVGTLAPGSVFKFRNKTLSDGNNAGTPGVNGLIIKLLGI